MLGSLSTCDNSRRFGLLLFFPAATLPRALATTLLLVVVDTDPMGAASEPQYGWLHEGRTNDEDETTEIRPSTSSTDTPLSYAELSF